MSKLKIGHIVETLVWLSIVLVFYVFSFEFDQEIEIYKYGATGWPRTILVILFLVSLGNFLQTYKKGSGSQVGRVGISDEDEEINYDDFSAIKKLLSILCLPLIFSISFCLAINEKYCVVIARLSLVPANPTAFCPIPNFLDNSLTKT